MSNFTTLHNTGVDIGYEYSTYILGTMFVMSEILPLLKGKSNGLLHALLCLINYEICYVICIDLYKKSIYICVTYSCDA